MGKVLAMNAARLRRFIADMTSLVGGAWQDKDEAAVIEVGRKLLGELVSHDDWLPESMARCPPHGYAQNLLWCDPFERFSMVSFVWAPSACTPVHDHRMWGLVGMLRGSEISQAFSRDAATGTLAAGEATTLMPGDVEALVPALGDIHRVTNALADCGSISIHLYGGNIGAVHRHIFDPETGEPRPFVSGYTNQVMPNLWVRSAEDRAGM
ncbi:cysteine dioxygenase [Enhydrobacter sp.]|jgi:predicted metal-dependent enzyme (double-stranded beta helix superfamily)|uniref:cysteine dioxygenase family protein n=1 Tax=Enhydrobacter sp. TaxID=1894999 RepID=UPI0026066590|nr:cysteine dioxygenase [Enhydrobacter sp.]WIM11994.1 MAG: Cysteine dioxygenase [Enhydrobacter sp.]